MPDREVHLDALRLAAVFEVHLHRIADVAQLRIEVVLRELLVLRYHHLVAQRIDARIACYIVFVVGRRQAPENQRHRNHVLQAVVAVCRVIERPGLVDDAYARFLRLDDDLPDVIDTVLDVLVQCHCSFDRGLRMKFRRVGNLEQHIFHDVAAVLPLELERLVPEEHVVEAPGFRRQCGRISHLAAHRDQREAHGAARCVARGPALAGAGVRRMPVGT